MCKYLNIFTNNRHTPKQEAQAILKYLLSKNSTSECIDIINILESLLENEMVERKKEASKTIDKINSKYHLQILVKDPIFEQPIKK